MLKGADKSLQDWLLRNCGASGAWLHHQAALYGGARRFLGLQKEHASQFFYWQFEVPVYVVYWVKPASLRSTRRLGPHLQIRATQVLTTQYRGAGIGSQRVTVSKFAVALCLRKKTRR